MRRTIGIGLTAALCASLAAGCSLFEDPTPDHISVRVSGGAPVEIVYSKQFVSGIDEQGVTRVQVFSTDTVFQALPLDTVIDISAERQFFVQITPTTSGTITVDTRVDVDDRTLVNASADMISSNPWRYVYQFNQQVTRIVDVVF